jgi:hypothetical protein
MGFLSQASNLKEMPVTVLTSGFQARCILPVMGVFDTFINDDQKNVLPLKNVTLYGLESGNPAASMKLDMLYVRKPHVHAIAFEQALPQDQIGLMPRVEQMVLYTSHYAIQAGYHMGADTVISDFIGAARAMFIGGTNASFFPVFHPQAACIQQAALVFIHRDAVRMYHSV